MINTIGATTFLFKKYLILSQILSKKPINQRDIINPSILSNLIRNGFGPVGL